MSRDAERSRAAILDAAEACFAAQGFAETTLQQVGAAAGLSRASPAYFFGSKDALHGAVLARLFKARQDATAAAFAPLRRWCEDEALDLREALEQATEDYLRFLLGRPAFVTLLVRDDLAGGERLRATPRRSTAMHDAFAAVSAVGGGRGLRGFDVDDVVLVLVSLTFTPLALRSTFMASLGRDLTHAATRRRHVELVADRVLSMLV